VKSVTGFREVSGSDGIVYLEGEVFALPCSEGHERRTIWDTGTGYAKEDLQARQIKAYLPNGTSIWNQCRSFTPVTGLLGKTAIWNKQSVVAYRAQGYGQTLPSIVLESCKTCQVVKSYSVGWSIRDFCWTNYDKEIVTLYPNKVMVNQKKWDLSGWALTGREQGFLLGGSGIRSFKDSSKPEWTLPSKEQVTALSTLKVQERYLASGDVKGVVRIWDLQAKTCLRTLQGPSSVKLCYFLPKGYLVVQYLDRWRIWESSFSQKK